jgi:hypothetical protein
MDCSAIGSTLAIMPVKAGGWRLGNESFKVHACFNKLACIGVNSSSDSSTSSRRQLSSIGVAGTNAGDALCAPGHSGFMCGKCRTGWYGYKETALCSECTGSMALAFVPMILLGIVAFIMVIVFIKSGTVGIDVGAAVKGGFAKAVENKGKQMAREATRKAVHNAAGDKNGRMKAKAAQSVIFAMKAHGLLKKYSVKLKILLSLWQILTNLGPIFMIPFPPFYESTVSSIGGLVQIELPSLMPVDCIVPMNFYSRLIFKTVWPIVAYVVLFFGSKALLKCGRKGQAEFCIDTLFLIMFILFPSLSSSLLSMFYCVPLDDGSTWLRVDLSLQCSDASGSTTASYAFMRLLTVIMLIVHTFGTFAIHAYLFFWKHHAALEALKEQELADAQTALLAENNFVDDAKKTVLPGLCQPQAGRLDEKQLLPGYIHKLTGGYEYRTCTLANLHICCSLLP